MAIFKTIEFLLRYLAGEELTPVVVARNISGGTAVVRGRISYTKSDGSRGIMPLREINLRAGEVKALEIVRGLKSGGIKSAGLEMDYDTQPGSVIVSALSVSRSSNHVFQIPMLDAAAQKSSTGVYPFYLYGSSSTVVYIKNTTGVEQKYVAHLNYEGGNYVMGVKTIAAGETVTIDVRALRDNQIADEEERTIPAYVSHGQARWTIIQSEGTDLLALMGRSEQVDEVKAISSTYACQNCCGDFAEDVFITPSQVEMQVGQSVAMSAFELRSDCYGFTYPVQQSASWSSSNSSVATVSGGQVTPNAGGETTIRASWNSFSSVATQCNPGSGILGPPDPIGTSCCRSLTNFRSATATVRVVPRVFISGAQTIMDGDSASFSIQSPDATPSSIAWSHTVPAGAGNNPNLTFSSTSGMATQTNGRWFALPNTECPATNCQSTYTINCTVDFSLGFNVRLTVNTSLTVNGCWNPAGFVDPFEARIIGVPAIAPDANGVWRVAGMGTLGRRIPTKHVLVSRLSQFFTKTDTHEQQHVDHWNPGNLFGNVHRPADFFARIQNFTGISQQDLLDRITADFQVYTAQQDAFVNANLNQTERLAYQVSDVIAPRYLYQNCGRY